MARITHTFTTLDNNAVVNLIKQGAVGVIPTDTVYGIVCDARNLKAVERLYNLKSRVDKPGTVIAASIEQLTELGIKRRYLKAVEQFWPGPVSVITPCSLELNYLDLAKGSLAVRLPLHKDLVSLLYKTGPLLTSSANQTGMPPAMTAIEAHDYFPSQLDFIVDGGTLNNLPSSIIRIIDDTIEVLRPGDRFPA